MTAFNRHHMTKGVCSWLCVALIACLFTLAPGARLARAEQGSLTVTSLNNTDATYNAYQVFLADIAADGTATHIAWASDEVRATVLAYLDGNGYGDWLSANHPGENQHDSAQNAAEYLSAMLGRPASEATSEQSFEVEGDTAFSVGLAQALAASEGIAPQTVNAGETVSVEQGLWLLVTTDATTADANEAGTAPIWISVGAENVELSEKTFVPTIDKQVQEDSTQAWGAVADANRGQDLSFCLTGTLPENFSSFNHYHYRFVDHFSEGIAPTIGEGQTLADAVYLYIDGNPVAPDDAGLTVSFDEATLVVDFADLKAQQWDAYDITAQSIITVRYQAHLTSAAVMGAKGNPNEAYLVYTDDPVSEQDGQTNTVVNKVFAYAIELHKKASDSGNPLEGAQFTLREQGADGRYVQQDGSLGDDPHSFATDGEGLISITGLDEGTYVLSEVHAPEGYEPVSGDVELCITSKTDAAGQTLESLEAEAATSQATVEAVDATTGVVSLSVVDGPASTGIERLAQTGGGPVAAVLVGSGLTLIAASHLHGSPSRKKRYRRRH